MNMADIELVIKIPEDKYKRFVKAPRTATFDECISDRKVLGTAIANGTPLPKGHGRLGDLDKLEKEIDGGIKAGLMIERYENYSNINDVDDCLECVKYADAIIEADGSEKE